MLEEDGVIAGFATYGNFVRGPPTSTASNIPFMCIRTSGGATSPPADGEAAGGGERGWLCDHDRGHRCDNAASIRMHERFGFTFAGKIVKAGYKFGRWLDLVFYQKLLDGPKQPVGE